MENYLESLLASPSEENLKRITFEINRANEIINNYHEVINDIIRKWWEQKHKEEIDRMELLAENEKIFLVKCREISFKISEALKNK